VMPAGDERNYTPESVAAKVARALLKAPVPKRRPRKRRGAGGSVNKRIIQSSIRT